MAKDYNTFSDVSTGDVYTAAAHNLILENVENYRVPPMCIVYRTTASASYSSNSNISWQAADVDTDSMWTSGTDITVNTDGLYLILFKGAITCSATLTALNSRVIGSASGGTHRNYAPAATSTSGFVTSSWVASLSAGEVVVGRMQTTGGSSHNILGGAISSETTTSMSLIWLGQAS